MLILAQDHPLESYPPLGPDYLAMNCHVLSGTAGTLYTYGSDSDGQRSLGLVVQAHGTNGNDPTVDRFFMVDLNGRIQKGDSGGPLLIDGMLVGVLRGSWKYADGREDLDFHGMSKALSLEMRAVKEERYYPGPWISDVKLANSKLSVTMSAELINSGKDVIFWVNGKYVGNVKNDIAYYCSKTNFKGGSVISPDTAVREGDRVQIGIGSGTETPDASELLFEKRFNGIQSVPLKNGTAVVLVSPALFNSKQRVIIWMNGAYGSEVFNNHVYYGGSIEREATGGAIIRVGAATPETYVQIGVVPDGPGDSFGTPATASLLYSGTFDGTLPEWNPTQPGPTYTLVGNQTSVPHVLP